MMTCDATKASIENRRGTQDLINSPGPKWNGVNGTDDCSPIWPAPLAVEANPR